MFACTDRYSDFLCEKKAEKKKDCVNSHESVWEQRVLFLGSCPTFLVKTYFGSLVKCKCSV